jgi:hypothetical protein
MLYGDPRVTASLIKQHQQQLMREAELDRLVQAAREGHADAHPGALSALGHVIGRLIHRARAPHGHVVPEISPR